MKRNLIVGLVLVSLLTILASLPIFAQSKAPVCAPADLIKQLATIKSTGDKTDDMNALLQLAEQIQAQNMACNGMNFTGDGKQALGPFDITKGQYRITLTTWDYSVNATILSIGAAKCVGEGYGKDQLFMMLMNADNMYGPKTVSTHTTIMNTAACRMVIEVDATNILGSKPWTLSIEPIQ
jgi:hypothetical protein